MDHIYRLCKCFQYAITAALNDEKNNRHSERITKIKPFINRYSWEGINYPSEKNDWKRFEKNNLTNTVNSSCAKNA